MRLDTGKLKDKKSPKYLMICDLIKTEIKKKSYHRGYRLPSCRDLSTELGASYLTVTNAMKRLEKEGVISCIQGKGNFVANPNGNESAMEIRTGFLMSTHGDLFQNFFTAVIHEFESKNVHLLPLHGPVLKANGSGEEWLVRIHKYADLGIENLIVLGERHFPYRDLQKTASDFEQIVFAMDYEADPALHIPGSNVIIPDFRKVGYLAGRHLLNNGWKNISFLTYEVLAEGARRHFGSSVYTEDMEVLDGIEDALKEHGIENFIPDVLRDNPSINELPELDRQIETALSCDKSAFVAMGDSRYRRILNVADKMGLKEGRDFGFVGMYNTSWSEAWNLSTVSIREDEIACLTVQSIVEKWKDRFIKVEPELIIRKSF